MELLWDTGLTVVVSAGNYGPAPGSVTVPGSSPKVITVGVPDTFPLSTPKGILSIIPAAVLQMTALSNLMFLPPAQEL